MARSAARRHLLSRLLAGVLLLGGITLGGYAAYLNHIVRSQFERKRWALPARVYASPLELYPGVALNPDTFASILQHLHYQTATTGYPGTYLRTGDHFSIVSRPFRFADGPKPARAFQVTFGQDHVASLQTATGNALALMRLEPEAIGALYPEHNEDRILLRLSQIPPTLIGGLLAVEDRSFYTNMGIAPTAMLRALFIDLRAGRAVEGASTITQQLARNFYLTPARTLRRKATEALMALLLTWHYSKHDILDTYMNEVYLGQNGDVAIHGFGLASEFYFGVPLAELDPAEQALLVGLVRGPSYYNPRRHPARALRRRNVVLGEMVRQHVLTAPAATAAAQEPLNVIPKPPKASSPYPAFLEVVRRELPRDYRDQDLRTGGLRIFTTLDPLVQDAAQAAVVTRLAILENHHHLTPGTLQSAVVVTSPQNGDVLALVGGRDPAAQGFNHALNAERQTGSVIKPVIYLKALEQPSSYTLATLLQDTPIQVPEPNGQIWSPRNYDRTYHGNVLLIDALAHSYNVATVRLGLALGMRSVLAYARRLGIQETLSAYPSTLLGASDLTPWDVTHLYETIASGGYRTPLRAIRAITTAHGRLLKRFALKIRRVASPDGVYLLTRAMQTVVTQGTARQLTRFVPATLNSAGKTGTTEQLRDSWFAGFTGNRLAVVWVGRDDDQPAGFTGAEGAMTIWGQLMASSGAAPLVLARPTSITDVWIDPSDGLRADRGCPGAVRLPFVTGSAPSERAPCAKHSILERLFAPLRRLFGQ